MNNTNSIHDFSPGNEISIIPYHIPVFHNFLNLLSTKVNYVREIRCKNLLKNYLMLLAPPSQFTMYTAANIVITLQHKIESEMKAIISKHHPYYWLHIYRRLAPENTFEDKDLQTVLYYRNILEAAAMKYGRIEIRNEFLKGDNIDVAEIMSGEFKKALEQQDLKKLLKSKFSGIYLKDFVLEDFIELLSLERLAREFHHTTACLRRIHKGGNLLIEDKQFYWVRNNEDIESLIESFDQRHEGIWGMVTTSGIPLFPQKFNSEGLCFLPYYNVSRIQAEDLHLEKIFNTDIKYTSFSPAPNFFWLPFDLDYYYSQHQFLSDEFKREYGFSIDCFVKCIGAIANDAWMAARNKPKILYNMLQRAYGHFKNRDEIPCIIKEQTKLVKIPTVPKYSPPKKEIEAFLEMFTLNEEIRSKIDLTTTGPRPIFINTWGNEFLIDYAALSSTLVTATHFLKADWTAKGLVFENYVIGLVQKYGLKIWKKQEKLKARDGTQIEIDLAIILKDIIFICELRTITRSFAFMKGEPKALSFRKEKLQDLLSDSEKKSSWLSKHKSGTNFSLPENIIAIVPIAVSPFTEYIWSSGGYYWLTDKIPRVCTPNELIEVIKEENLPTILGKQYIIKVV